MTEIPTWLLAILATGSVLMLMFAWLSYSLAKKLVRTGVEFHQHIEWYGDKSRAARGEDVLDLEELLDLVPESYKVTPEEVEDSGVTRVVNALPTFGVGMVRSAGEIETELNRHVKVYGDVARIKRGEKCLGDEPFMFFIKKSLRLATRH